MTPIRILHIMDKVSVDGSKIHGPARQLAYRIPCYPPGRFQVMLCNLRREDPACDILRASGIEVVSLNTHKLNPFTLFAVMRLVRQWRPDILHAHGYAAFNFARVAGRLLGVPTVVQEHFVDERYPRYQQAIDFALRGWQDHALAVSDAVKDFMSGPRFIPAAQIEVLGNGVPTDRIKRPADARLAELRAQWGIPAGAPVIGTVGRLAEMKGQKYFLEAAARLADARPDARFVVVGDGPLAAELRAQAARPPLAGRVVFPGYQENAVEYLALFDVAVVSSIFGEGFCAVGIEAFAVGTPLVITNLPCFKDLYRPDANVLMVPPRDAPAMADAIAAVLDRPDLRARLVQAGRATLAEYAMDRIAARYVALYERMLAARRRQP